MYANWYFGGTHYMLMSSLDVLTTPEASLYSNCNQAMSALCVVTTPKGVLCVYFIKQNMKAVFIVMQLQKCPGVLNLYLISVLFNDN